MRCEICGSEVSKFDVKCKVCGAFIQNPVHVLYLFETISELIFNPSNAFHKIILSERKNFAVFLASIFGVVITFDLFHFIKVGEKVGVLILILLYSFGFGVPLGVVLVLVISIFVKFLLSFVRERIDFKSIFALISYSMFPIAFSFFFLLPAFLAVFGIYYFTESPELKNFKPIPFYILSFVSLSLKLYSLLLLAVAFKYVTGNFLRGFMLVILTSIYLMILLNLLAEFLGKFIF